MRIGTNVAFNATDTVYGDEVSLATLVATSANANGVGIRMEDRTTLRLSVDVTNITGTLTVTVSHSGDGTTWRAHTAMSGITTISTVRQVFAGLDRYARVTWAIVTGPVTATVTGEAL